MAEGSTEQGAAVGRQGAAGTHGSTSVARQGDRAGGLQTEKGATTIADTVADEGREHRDA